MLGAGYTVSPETGDVATYVKLLRVTMLIPVVFAISGVLRGAEEASSQLSAPLSRNQRIQGVVAALSVQPQLVSSWRR